MFLIYYYNSDYWHVWNGFENSNNNAYNASWDSFNSVLKCIVYFKNWTTIHLKITHVHPKPLQLEATFYIICLTSCTETFLEYYLRCVFSNLLVFASSFCKHHISQIQNNFIPSFNSNINFIQTLKCIN